MKKIIAIVFIALLGTTGVKAQASFGIKGGVNFASIAGNVNSAVRYRTGFNVGVVTEIETSPVTSVQPEILYSSQGFYFRGGRVGGIDGDYFEPDTFKLDYLNIPLVFKYYINEGFSIESGPQLGFLLSATSKNGTVQDSKISDNLTTASFDWLLGFGYKFDNGFNVNARYSLGLTNIWKGPVSSPPPGYWYYYDYGILNNVFQLTIG